MVGRVADRADTIHVAEGQYLKWAPPSGEQLWLQVKANGDAMGMNPHFEGRSSVPIAIEGRIARQGHTPLDGTFLAWANPPGDGTPGGDYPFAFDCPDAATHADLALPAVRTAQVVTAPAEMLAHVSAVPTCTGVVLSVVDPVPSCPKVLSEQYTMEGLRAFTCA